MKNGLVLFMVMVLTACAGNGGNTDPDGRMQVVNERLSVTNSLGLLPPVTFSLTLSANLVPPPTQDGFNLQFIDSVMREQF